MKLSQADVQKIAHLARLTISEQDAQKLSDQLSNILTFVDQMNAVSTENVAPIAHAFDLTQRLRPDIVTETNQRDAFQKIAPAVEAGLYLVPKVIEST